mgnify:CR=1 FL=1
MLFRSDPQTLTRAGLDGLGQHFALEYFKGIGVAKPQGFVGGHGIDHHFLEPAARLALNPLDQLTEGLYTLLFHQFVETAGYQILLVFTEQYATGFFQEDPELFEIQITRRQ